MNAAYFDVIVIGGGPSGSTAAQSLAAQGWSVMLLDRQGRTKPCGGAIPPRLIKDYQIPDELIVAKIKCARMVAPSSRQVDIPIDNGYVGMVDRDVFDEWLRQRAARHGAVRERGRFERLEADPAGGQWVHYEQRDDSGSTTPMRAHAGIVIGADGARSEVARQAIANADKTKLVFAYHEILQAPHGQQGYDPERCDVWYQGHLSPDFYGWVFPHGNTLSVGTGSADKGFSLRTGVARLREAAGLTAAATLRREGAPIPLKPLPRWDNGRDVILTGDAAGVVAPSSGEGIYYAMACGTEVANAVHASLKAADPALLKTARKKFLKEHGKVFWVLGLMQHFWYQNDRRRERFVAMCDDRDVQQLTFDAYMNKRLVRRKPMAHVKIFFKDLAHLFGFARV
jgi:geranylgeranyl reductase